MEEEDEPVDDLQSRSSASVKQDSVSSSIYHPSNRRRRSTTYLCPRLVSVIDLSPKEFSVLAWDLIEWPVLQVAPGEAGEDYWDAAGQKRKRYDTEGKGGKRDDQRSLN